MSKSVFDGHMMPGHVGDRPRRLARAAKLYKAAGAAIFVLVVAVMPKLAVENVIDKGGSVAGAVSYGAVGVGCGGLLFGGLPWMVGVVYKWQSRQRAYLDGVQLTVIKVYGNPVVFDLSRAHVAVELVGGRFDNIDRDSGRFLIDDRSCQFMRGATRGRRRIDFVPMHPVLVLYDDDGSAVPIELCFVPSSQMRDSAEIVMLAQAIASNPDPRAQHAAGQLRTVARWPRLPYIVDAAADAVPATSADLPAHAEAPPTPVRVGEPAREIRLPADSSHVVRRAK